MSQFYSHNTHDNIKQLQLYYKLEKFIYASIRILEPIADVCCLQLD